MSAKSVTEMGHDRSQTLAQQAFALRRLFPAAATHIRPTRLGWIGILTPTPLSRDYTVRITYSLGEYPKVAILDPPLLPDRNGLLPHFYREGSLCLHETNEWNGSMLIVDTIVPWTAEWLAYYELWKQTGRWYGDGDPAEGTAATTVSAPANDDGSSNRAERRRHERDIARRARRDGPRFGVGSTDPVLEALQQPYRVS